MLHSKMSFLLRLAARIQFSRACHELFVFARFLFLPPVANYIFPGFSSFPLVLQISFNNYFGLKCDR